MIHIDIFCHMFTLKYEFFPGEKGDMKKRNWHN